MLLSTELQRSTREREREDLVKTALADIDRLAAAPGEALREALKAQVKRLARTNVEVYGAIYVKTDGKRLITAFRIEEGSETEKWFYFEYVFTASGELVLA